jgi:hypothetical protein
MSRKLGLLPQNGPLAELISRINHLGSLLENLPCMTPQSLEHPEAHYNFGLDAEHIADEGI